MRFRRSAFLLATVLGVVFAGVASAFVVEQKVTYGGNAKSEAVFNWLIGAREFRLDVRRGEDTRSFVFNGRVFYVCGKLDKAALDALKNLNIDDKALVASLEKGACQEASTDFATKFFLSPWDAVGSVGTGGGYGSSLAVEEPEIELTGSMDAAQGVKCVGFTRSYKITDRTNAATQTAVSEKSCNATAIKWRQAFTRELGMTLMRQPGGKPSFQAITGDNKKMAGLSLTMTSEAKGKDASGKPFVRSVTADTTMVKDKTPTTAELGTPAGFQIIDPTNFAALAAKSNVKPTAGGDAGSGIASVLGALILGTSPAAALQVLTSGGDEKKK